jgi:cell division protease FtsH
VQIQKTPEDEEEKRLKAVGSFVWLAAMVGAFWLILRPNSLSGLSGKLEKATKTELKKATKFKDVAGLGPIKKSLEQMVDILKDPKKYNDLGAKLPKGVLLYGPPGTGKTLIAKAVAGEAGVPFYSVSAPELSDKYVGEGARKVRDLFEKAQKTGGIIFIDEFDSLGGRRNFGSGGGDRADAEKLNQFLTLMDGFESEKGKPVMVIAATNAKDALDPAVLRPGRLDRHLEVPLPNLQGRKDILAVHAANKTLANQTADLARLAGTTQGYSGADLAGVLNEAALIAAEEKAPKITWAHLDEATLRKTMGLKMEGHHIPLADLERTAVHELGHAIAGLNFYEPNTFRIVRGTIEPRSNALGHVAYTTGHEGVDNFKLGKQELEARMCMALAGRVAEETVYGKHNVASGASGDFESVRAMAEAYVRNYGMGKGIVPRSYGSGNGYAFEHSEHTKAKLDAAIDEVIERCYRATEANLQANKALLQQVAGQLLQAKTMDGKDLTQAIMPALQRTPHPNTLGKVSLSA